MKYVQDHLLGWLVVWGLTPLKQLRSYHGGRWRTCTSWLSHTSTNTTFFPKPPTTFLTCFGRDGPSFRIINFLHFTLHKTAKIFTVISHPLNPLLYTHQQQTFENIVGKEEIARNKQFSLFPTIFSTQ